MHGRYASDLPTVLLREYRHYVGALFVLFFNDTTAHDHIHSYTGTIEGMRTPVHHPRCEESGKHRKNLEAN